MKLLVSSQLTCVYSKHWYVYPVLLLLNEPHHSYSCLHKAWGNGRGSVKVFLCFSVSVMVVFFFWVTAAMV